MRIFLADLGHNLLTLSSDVYPLGIANLAMYAKSHLPEGEALEFEIFREPQDLKKALDAGAPDVLGLSNYAWNQELAIHFANYAKRVSPNTLTAMGGPNWPLFTEVQEQVLRGIPDVDVYVEGPTYEGERAFANLLERYRQVGGRIAGIYDEPIDGVAWIHPESGDFQKAPAVPRIRDLDDIPSPYLSGLLDPFFKTGYFPLMQITRGCPFTCAFCNSGVHGNSKAFAHSIENVKADLDYIVARVKPETTLCFADDNFGMYEQDVEIADYIGFLQDKHGWPRYIRTTTGKNRGDRIIQVMRKVRGALPMTSAVQSMNPVVLKNIKRSNIKLETYQELQDELHRQGMQSYGELILCLPGETKESFMSAVEQFLDAGAKRISAHQLMLLHGAELANPDSREKFQFDTRHRVVARNIGNYTGTPVIEVEEMVVQTPDFSYQDYLDSRVFHLLLTIFQYEGNYEEAFQFAHQNGVKPFELAKALQARLPQAPPEFRKVIEDFTAEGEAEIFDTREECLAWALEHYDELVSGELGGNLLSKYSMIGRFLVTEHAIDFLEDTIGAALHEAGREPVGLEAVMAYLRGVLLQSPFMVSMDREVSGTLSHDVAAWANADYKQPISDFEFEAPRHFTTRLDAGRRKLITAKVETFGDHPSGLGKFTRTMFARDLRRDIVMD